LSTRLYTEATIRKLTYIISAVLLISLAAVASTFYILETYGSLPFEEEQSMEEQWLKETRLQEEFELLKEVELLTKQQLLAELESLKKTERPTPQESLIAEEMLAKLKPLFREQLASGLLTEEQAVRCAILAKITLDVQLWRKHNEGSTYKDFIDAQGESHSIIDSMAFKVFKVIPLYATPEAAGADFQAQCRSNYRRENREKEVLMN